MEEKHDLYLMISRTESGVGRLIRRVSQYPYNHVSLTLDESFRSFISFARYHHDAPLYGGYIRESAERFLAGERDAAVRLFRLPLSPERRERLEALFSHAGQKEEKLVYNLLDALLFTGSGRLHIPGAYTCLSFTGKVLDKPFRSIQELDAFLTPNLIFSGNLSELVSDSGDRSDPYFIRVGKVRGFFTSSKLILRLLWRAFRPEWDDLVKTLLKS